MLKVNWFHVILGQSEKYILRANMSGKADVWKKFSIVYEKLDSEENLKALDFAACNKCKKVYQLKDSSGNPLGTKNLLEHLKRCTGGATQTQLKLQQCLTQSPQLTKVDLSNLKRKEVVYCVEGYNSFKSVEHDGFVSMMQTCVDLGAKYGKFDVGKTAVGRKAVSREVVNLASDVKKNLVAELKPAAEDGSVALCIDMYTDDYRKKSYLDVHASWVDRDFSLHHAALAVRHFGPDAHTGDNISTAVNGILAEYNLSEEDTPVTTDHGANIVAALRNNVRLDCFCHRLHTVLETAWRDTKNDEPEASRYETAVSDLCRFAKQSTGIQEQLPKSLKHGGDTRPWTSMYHRAESIEASYEALVTVLTAKNKLELIASVNRSLNHELMELTKSIKDVFESLEKVNEPTLSLVAPSYYLLAKKFRPVARDSAVMQTFRKHLTRYLDEKVWTSISALHWMASFLDPSFKNLTFVESVSAADTKFKRNLLIDLDQWILTEMKVVADNMADNDEINPR